MTETTAASGHLLGSATRPVVVVDRELAATTTEVWDAWTQPDRLVRWLGAVESPLTVPGRPVRMAMAAKELPAVDEEVENLATFTVIEAEPPVGGGPARLVFTFDDAADPGGTVSVELTPVPPDRCRLALRHALVARVGALGEAPGFGAGWEGFLDWLQDALADRAHGDDRYAALLPHYEALCQRLGRVRAGEVTVDGGWPAVRHRRIIAAPVTTVWALLTDNDGLARWLGTVVDGRLGVATTVVIVHDGDDPSGSSQTSTVQSWVPPQHLAMSWDMPGEATSSLEITLREEDGATALELVHHGVGAPPDEYLPGWHAHLDLLTAEAEGWGRPPFSEALAAAQR